jgi:hypothetical protein
MIRIFTGHDVRESMGTWVFTSSVLDHASEPVSFIPLHKPLLERAFGTRFAEGTNAFTASRFAIPALCDFQSQGPSGLVIFADGADMLCRADVAELRELYDPSFAVQVCKHSYQTRHPVKYVGTPMAAENRMYPMKQYASFMLINPGHKAWRPLTPDRIAEMPLIDLLQFRFMDERFIGDLPLEWNHLCDELGESETAKILHWTAGVPGFLHYERAPHAGEWFRQVWRMTHACG